MVQIDTNQEIVKKIIGRYPMQSPNYDFLKNKICSLNLNYAIVHTKNPKSKFKCFIKKSIRFIIRPILNPFIGELNQLNQNLIENIYKNNIRINELENEVKKLHKKIDKIE